jgi:hypothetical protein
MLTQKMNQINKKKNLARYENESEAGANIVPFEPIEVKSFI